MKILLMVFVSLFLVSCSNTGKQTALNECVGSEKKFLKDDSPVRIYWSNIVSCMEKRGFLYDLTACPGPLGPDAEYVYTGAEFYDCYTIK